jgi:hypothetical protein
VVLQLSSFVQPGVVPTLLESPSAAKQVYVIDAGGVPMQEVALQYQRFTQGDVVVAAQAVAQLMMGLPSVHIPWAHALQVCGAGRQHAPCACGYDGTLPCMNDGAAAWAPCNDGDRRCTHAAYACCRATVLPPQILQDNNINNVVTLFKPRSWTTLQQGLVLGGTTKVCCVCVLRVRAFVAGTRARLHLVVLSSGVCVHVCMCACMRINACGALMSGVRAAAAQGP